jgi:hypothetical protein
MKPRLYIEVGGITTYDWQVVNDYLSILRPLYKATSMLKGRGKAGSNGAIWEVIPIFNWLLIVLKEQKDRVAKAIEEDYPDQEAIEDHIKININAAWSKLNEYFKKLDETPIYYAAVILHPYTKLFCENAWKDRPNWLETNDANFQAL